MFEEEPVVIEAEKPIIEEKQIKWLLMLYEPKLKAVLGFFEYETIVNYIAGRATFGALKVCLAKYNEANEAYVKPSYRHSVFKSSLSAQSLAKMLLLFLNKMIEGANLEIPEEKGEPYPFPAFAFQYLGVGKMTLMSAAQRDKHKTEITNLYYLIIFHMYYYLYVSKFEPSLAVRHREVAHSVIYYARKMFADIDRCYEYQAFRPAFIELLAQALKTCHPEGRFVSLIGSVIAELEAYVDSLPQLQRVPGVCETAF
jgi:hypothetical protein